MVSGWSSIEKFLPKTTKLTKEREKLKDLFIKSKPDISRTILPPNATSVSNLESEALTKVLETLQLQMIPHNVLTNFSALCDIVSSELYFPLKDIDGVIVGYKRLYKIRNDVVEETFPEHESFGVVKSQQGKKDSTSAILVLSIMDLLALATQKINCKFHF